MSIRVRCEYCGRELRARERFAGTRAECPDCGFEITVPPAPTGQPLEETTTAKATAAKAASAEVPLAIVDFLDPPLGKATTETPPPSKPVMQRMMEALLDPHAISWILGIGGGLTILGLVIWLISLKVFDDPRIMAAALGLGSAALIGAGWWTTLKTKFQTAGEAVTFLGCVAAPLNLWFYHSQDLIKLDQHLWVGGVICTAIYAATVRILKRPLFMYAIEVGVTLTTLLLLADLHQITKPAHLAVAMVVLAFLSIHAERAFAPNAPTAPGEPPRDDIFDRQRFGMPLFWSGHVQLAAGLLILMVSQFSHWISDALTWNWQWPLSHLTENTWLAAGLYLAGFYLYFYSDIVVRRLGVYSWLGAFCLIMAQVTLLVPHLGRESVIVVLAVSALALQLALRTLSPSTATAVPDAEPAEQPVDTSFESQCGHIVTWLSAVPIALGLLLHLQATSEVARFFMGKVDTTGTFLVAMLIAAVTNRISAMLSQNRSPQAAATHFFLSAAAVLMAAAGGLRFWGYTGWSQQAVPLMLIPIGYILAARAWRGRQPETPLARVAHVATFLVLLSTFVDALEHSPLTFFAPRAQVTANLWLGVAFLEAMIFYILAGVFRRRSWNVYLATAAGCASMWQFLGYFGAPHGWHTLMYACLGLVLLIVSRFLGLETVTRYGSDGHESQSIRGPGWTPLRSGNAVLTFSLVAAIFGGLGAMAVSPTWADVRITLLCGVAGGIGFCLVPASGWRRLYAAATIALACETMMLLNLLSLLTGWQKLEIFCGAIGVILLGVGYFGRFREAHEKPNDDVSVSLLFGSLLAAVPVFIAMLHYRFFSNAGISTIDEFGLVTISLLMLLSGCVFRVKATTLIGGSALGLYLLCLFGQILYRPQVAIGVYLLAGGGVIFVTGVLLSIYRDRLIALPGQIARREGLFRIIDWR